MKQDAHVQNDVLWLLGTQFICNKFHCYMCCKMTVHSDDQFLQKPHLNQKLNHYQSHHNEQDAHVQNDVLWLLAHP